MQSMQSIVAKEAPTCGGVYSIRDNSRGANKQTLRIPRIPGVNLKEQKGSGLNPMRPDPFSHLNSFPTTNHKIQCAGLQIERTQAFKRGLLQQVFV